MEAKTDMNPSAREVAMQEALQKIADDWPRLTNEGAQKWARDALALAATIPPEPAAVPEADRLARQWLSASPAAMMKVNLAGALLRDALHPVTAPKPKGEGK
jgi:hypothetical protein